MSTKTFPDVQIIHGDCNDILRMMSKKCVDCVYLDPPFNSGRNYVLDHNSQIGFKDKWTNDDYRTFITTLIDNIIPLMKSTASLFFHISADQMFIPEVILREKFKHVTPIFWKKSRSKNNVKKKLGTAIDILFWCSNGSKRKFNLLYQPKDPYYEAHSFKNKDARGNYALGHLVTEKSKSNGYKYSFTVSDRVFNPAAGWRIRREALEKLEQDDRLHVPTKATANLYKKIYLHENPGKPCMDLWDDIYSIAQGKETRKYPTAKPIKLLERIIKMTTDEGDVVLDPMAGSGTSGQAAKQLKRKCILIDQNHDAVNIMKDRLHIQ